MNAKRWSITGVAGSWVMTPKTEQLADIVCIAFDFDGTLVDSNSIKYDAFFEVLGDVPHAFPFLEDLLKHSYTETRHTVFAKVANHLLPNEADKAAALAKQYVQDYSVVTERRVAASPEISGAEAMLERLHVKGYTLAVVSATPAPSLTKTIEKRGWRNKFSYVYGAPASKADNLRDLSQSLAILPQQMIMVGDRKNDLQGAEAIKCPFIGLIRPDSDFNFTPQYAIQHLDDLDAMIEHISAETHHEPIKLQNL